MIIKTVSDYASKFLKLKNKFYLIYQIQTSSQGEHDKNVSVFVRGMC